MTKRDRFKTWTWILVGLQAMQVLGCVFTYFNVYYQFVSPLIPKEIVDRIAKPYKDICIITCGSLVLAIVLAMYGKYKPSIIVSVVVLMLTFVSEQYFS